MDPVTIAALIGAGSSAVNMVSQGATNRKNREFQREMWNKTNAYNTPLAQRKRMEAAGFNPNMMYGHGTVANTASNVNMPDGTAPQIGDISSQYVAAKRMGADLELKTEQSAVSRITAANMVEQGRGYALDNFNKTLDAALKMSDTDLKAQAIAKGQMDLDRYTDFQNENLRQLRLGNTLTSEKTEGQVLSNKGQSIKNKMDQINLDWLPRDKQRQAQMDFTKIDNMLEDTKLKQSLQRLQNISGHKLQQEIQNLKTSRAGGQLDNIAKELRAIKASYGLDDSQLASILNIGVGPLQAFLSDAGAYDKEKRTGVKKY